MFLFVDYDYTILLLNTDHVIQNSSLEIFTQKRRLGAHGHGHRGRSDGQAATGAGLYFRRLVAFNRGLNDWLNHWSIHGFNMV